MRIFVLIWLGQTISMVGSHLVEFALGVWAYQQTESVTQFAVISLLMYLPQVIISPIAGALVDGGSRRFWMILGDSMSAVLTCWLFALVYADQLAMWHIYVAVGVNSIFTAFHWPAYTAGIAQLVPQQNFNLANGMVQASRAAGKIVAPVLAGVLINAIQLEGVLLIDLLSFVFAVTTLSLVKFPPVQKHEKLAFTSETWNRIRADIIFGWKYIKQREGLLWLLILFGVIFFTEGVLQVVFWPLILSFSSSIQLGIVLCISGFGLLFGSVLISTWGGPRRRVYGVLWFVPLQGLLLCLGGFQPSIISVAFGAFGYLLVYPIIVSCNRTIWQNKVPLNLQGRVFSLQLMLEKSLAIVAYCLSGPLVDNILEPWMNPGGLLADSIGRLIGVGKGRGIGLLFILLGIFNIVMVAIASKQPRLTRIETELPDGMEMSKI